MTTSQKYRRTRVAIDVPMYAPQPSAPAGFMASASDNSVARLHIGHARTILLGSLIAQEYGIPFHIRIDAIKRNETDVHGIFLDLMGITHFLGIHVDDCYWLRQTELPHELVAKCLGDKAETFWSIVNLDYLQDIIKNNLIADDMFYNSPSLIVRGTEFVEPERFYPPPDGAGMAILLKWIRYLYDALDIEMHEVNVPLIFAADTKLSKSSGNIVDWEILRVVEPEDARAFLVATAIDPDDPLASLGKSFNTEDLAYEPYEWSWQIWSEFTTKHGGRNAHSISG